MASNDTLFVSKVTNILAVWLNNINDFCFKGRNPNYTLATGTVNGAGFVTAYVVTFPTASLYNSLTIGDTFTFQIQAANAPGCTLNINGTGDNAFITQDGSALAQKTLHAASSVTVTYDGTSWRYMSDPAVYTQASTNKHFVQDGAKVNRFNDRVFIGGATANDGVFPNTLQDWLSAYMTSASGTPFLAGPTVSTNTVILNNNDPADDCALTTGAQSLNFTSAGACIAHSSFVLGNNATYAGGSWASYLEAHLINGASGGCWGQEINVVNQTGVDSGSVWPYNFSAPQTIGLQISAGGAWSGTNNLSAALVIGDNGSSWGKGLVFLSGSVTATSSISTAVALPTGYQIAWYEADIAELVTGKIICNVSIQQKATHLAFQDNGMYLADWQGAPIVIIPGSNSSSFITNFIELAGGFSGSGAVTISAGSNGGDSNIDIALTPLGTGTLNVAVPTISTIGADGSSSALTAHPVGYMQIKIAGALYNVPYYNHA